MGPARGAARAGRGGGAAAARRGAPPPRGAPPVRGAAGARGTGGGAGGAPEGEFLAWLAQGGVAGLEGPGGLYSGAGPGGGRGVVAARAVAPGELVFRVPAELGLSDAWDPGSDGPELYPGAPWGARLAAKLLRASGEGPTGTRAPWLAVLPDHVPSLYFFDWDEAREVQYAPLLAELDRYGLLVQDSLRAAGGPGSPALGGASREQWEWAMSVVHSRSFGVLVRRPGGGTAAPGAAGGEESDGLTLVRLMVPLVDMFNHSGDVGFYTRGAAAPDSSAGAVWEAVEDGGGNLALDVRGAGPPEDDGWGDVPGVSEVFVPEDGDEGEHDWKVAGGPGPSEAVAVGPGEEIFFSYGDRANDDWLLHYGFVPTHNPHDSFEIFGGLPEALEWYAGRFLAGLDPEEAGRRRAQALAAAAAAEEAAAAGEAGEVRAIRELQRAGEAAGGGELRDPVYMLLGGRPDPRLTPAFAAMAGAEMGQDLRIATDEAGSGEGEVVLSTALDSADLQAADAAVVARCVELLEAFPTSLVEDLELLAGLPSAEQSHFLELLRHFSGGEGRPRPESEGPNGVPWTDNLYLAVAFRAHKKLVLEDAIGRLAPPP